MAPLNGYVQRLRAQRPDWYVPDFDPASGGIDSKILFLFEKPGPKTVDSGFLSINNDDPTAAATYQFLSQRGLPSNVCLFANVIPWWDGVRKISSEQRMLATDAVIELLGLLPRLKGIVLVGRTAQRTWKRIGVPVKKDIMIFESFHPSPIVRAHYRERWEQIPHSWPDQTILP